jgi:colanic acid/amylovoran biosynthesis glycosyltransferase
VKLAYVTALFPYAHAEQFFEEELRSLSRTVDVTVIPTRPPSRTAVYRDVGTPLHLPLLSARVARMAAREALRNPGRALATFAQLALDPRSSLRARAVNVAAFPKALAVASEVRRLGIDHIHAAWLTTPATIAWVASRMTGVAFSATAHQHDIFAGNLAAQKVAAASFVRVISERNARHLREQLSPELARRVLVGHLGVAIPADAAPHPPRTPRILCAARLCSWKGHRDLLEALALLRARGIAFTCDLAGDGELRAEVTADVARLELGPLVRMLGNVPHPELVRALAAGDYDVFALASTERPGEHEGIPVAVMEAMAAGLPVVATATGSLDELVGPEHGALVPQRDPEALARALALLLGDAATRERIGRAAREKIRADFETEATTRILLGFIAAPA